MDKRNPYSLGEMRRIYGDELINKEDAIRLEILSRKNYVIFKGAVKEINFAERINHPELILSLMKTMCYIKTGSTMMRPNDVVAMDIENNICQLLELKTTLLNYREKVGGGSYLYTPLSYAIENKCLKIVDLILKHPHIDVNYEYQIESPSALYYDDNYEPNQPIFVHPALVISDQFDSELVLNGLYYKLLSHPDIKLRPQDYQNIMGTLNHMPLNRTNSIEDIQMRIQLFELLTSKKDFNLLYKDDYKLWLNHLQSVLTYESQRGAKKFKKTINKLGHIIK